MRKMKEMTCATLLLFSVAAVSCKKQADVVEISQTRPLTSHDDNPVVDASSAEQFLPPDILKQIEDSGQKLAGSSSSSEGEGNEKWTYRLPATDWKVAEPKTFREINLTFGSEENAGEIYLSTVGGGLQANIDRWFRQFGNEPKPLAQLERLTFLEKNGYLIEAAGRYEPGMGRAGKDKQALLGAIVENDGRLVTVKMIGSEEEISSRRAQFLEFMASLRQN